MKPGSDIGTRIMGLVLFLVGTGLGYWQIYLPIMQASRGEPNINYFTEAVLATPLGMLFGLFLIVFGARGLEFLAQRPSKLVMILILVFTLLFGFGCIFGMQYIMRSFGYY
jgi:hypothetical protein